MMSSSQNRALPIGMDDFRMLRERQLVYVDKSDLIGDLIDHRGAPVVLLLRPRRFGKSLALSMLHCFFAQREQDLSHLFTDLAVWQRGESYREHFQRYPVIQLRLGDMDAQRFDDVLGVMREKLRDLFDEHRGLLDCESLSGLDRGRFARIVSGDAAPEEYQRALFDLTRLLHRAYGCKVMLFIDDYDRPLRTAQEHGYFRLAFEFFRGLYGKAMMANPHLERAVLAGVLWPARDGVDSGLERALISNLLQTRMAECCGFTEDEVQALMDEAELSDDDVVLVRRWYGGYTCGERRLYNPWSVMRHLDYIGQVPREERDQSDVSIQPRAHWLPPAALGQLRRLIEGDPAGIGAACKLLLAGDSIECTLSDHVFLEWLDSHRVAEHRDMLWSYLVSQGYVRAEVVSATGATWQCTLSVPNREARLLLDACLHAMAQRSELGDGGPAESGTRVDKDEESQAMEAGTMSSNAAAFEDELQGFLEEVRQHEDESG